MKHMKKFTAMLLAVIMVLGMALSASAATVTNNTGHTYEAYQILTGTQAQSEGTLGDVKWGTGINVGAFLTALKADDATKEAFATVTDEASFAKILNGNKDNSDLAKAVARIADQNKKSGSGIALTTGENELADGYYLIVDTSPVNGTHDAKNTSLLQVTRDIAITEKSAKPTVDKQVWDEATDGDAGKNENWGETADHNINESFQFKLTANFEADEDYDAYESYKVVFNDTMSNGITFESIAKVVVDGVELTVNQYTHTGSADKQSWTLTIDDIKCITGVNLKDGATVEVIYNAHLNENAVISNPGNTNTVFLQYSNNPNATGEGEELGKTNEDTVWVFTYDIDAKKVDGEDHNKTLAGAEFKLYRGTDEAKEYVILDDNFKVIKWEPETAENKGKVGTVITSKAGGEVKIIGLDHGTYYLEETKAPAGYNILTAPIEIKIVATHSENTTGAATTVTVNNGLEETVIQVENNAGVTLPETGGMGTTMFYAVGAVLVLAAVVLLVTKRRMRAE